MTPRESPILRAINVLQLPGVLARLFPLRLWRNSKGGARQGNRFHQYGLLAPGSSDLVGYTSVTITPAMIGQTVALFTAIEVKAPGGRVEPDQRHFVDRIISAGGVGGIAHSEAEAREIVLARLRSLGAELPEE